MIKIGQLLFETFSQKYNIALSQTVYKQNFKTVSIYFLVDNKPSYGLEVNWKIPKLSLITWPYLWPRPPFSG